jgi:plastocyanin
LRKLCVLPLGAALALVAAAGCGGDGGGSSEPVATTEIGMVKSYRFEPKVIEVEVGASVTWTNEDNFTHTVRVEEGEDHTVERGKSVSLSFDEPGTYHYVCSLHSRDMQGDVIVT